MVEDVGFDFPIPTPGDLSVAPANKMPGHGGPHLFLVQVSRIGRPSPKQTADRRSSQADSLWTAWSVAGNVEGAVWVPSSSAKK